MGFISWMADKLGIGDGKKKKKKKTTSKGVTSVVKDMSHVSKDAATINSKSTSAKQKQAARNRISSYKSGNDVYKTGKVYQSGPNRSSRVSGQSKKTTTKKRDERSTFEKFSQSQLKSIKAGATKTNTPKQDTKKLSNAYDAYKKRLEGDRAKKKAEEEKKERQELSKNSLVQMQKSQQETLNKLRAERKKLKEGNLAKADPQKEIDKLNKEIRAVKNDRKFAKSYKKEQGEKAKKQLDKQLKSMSLSGTQETKKKVEQKAEEEKKRKQEVLDKVYNRRVDKREDNSKMSDTEKASIYTDPVRAAAARSGNPKTVYTKKQREEMRKSVQKGLDKGQFGAGLLQGSMLVGDLYDAVEKQYGIKLDRTKYNKSTSAKVGEAVGMLAMSAVPGATTEAAAAKSLTKALAKVTGKKATSKAAKAAATIAAESAASLPMNVADAAKNSEDGKTFAKNLAENVALDAGLNGVMEGASALLKNTAKSKAGQALVKMGKGENLTQQEQDAFNKVVSRAAAKSATNKKLSKLEEVVLKTAQNRNTKKNLTSVAEGRSLKAGNKVETKKYLDTKQKSLRYQASSQALPDDSYLSADRLSTTNISESSVKSNTNINLNKKDIKVGHVTKIKEPYDGKVPEQPNYTHKDINVKKDSVVKAERNIREAGGDKKLLRKVYEQVFSDEGGSRTRTIKDMSYDGKPYDVFIGKKAVGKVISDPKMSAEKLAVFDNIDEIIENAEYVGSGKYVPHGAKQKDTERFDYFENQIKIGDENYVVSFDVEVFPSSNNYRTHKITKIDLVQTPATDVGPVPTATEVRSSLNTSISESSVKSNTSEKISDETLYKQVSAMREKDFTDDDILAQFEKMGVEPQRAFEVVDNANAKKYKQQSAKQIYDRANKGASRAEIGQHYEKLKKQITEELGDNDFLKEMELAERRGNFNKKNIMSQNEARAQAKREAEEDLDTTYMKVVDASKGDDEHLFYARASEVVNRLRDNIKNGIDEAESSLRLMNVLQKTNDVASESGRMLNSTKIILRATPEGRLRTVDREVKNLSTKFKDRLGGKELKLSEDQISRITKAETDEEIEKVIKDVNLEIWDQIPASAFEKINEFRHFAMLANLKTHGRNVIGNTAFKAARSMSNGIEIALNRVAKGHIEKMGGKVDMVKVSSKEIRDNKKYLDSIFDKAYKESGSQSRYVESVRPDGSRTIKFAPINAAIQANYKALEWEDMITFKPEYNKNYVRWCKSHGIDTSDLSKLTKKQHEAANAYAMRKAEEATFRDACALSEFITGKKTTLAGKKGSTPLGTAVYRAGNMLLESQLPFVKTPINVFRRSVDYSPVGLIRGTAELLTAKNPEIFKQGLHQLATGLTGTGVFALGMWLADKDAITLKAGEKSGDAYYDYDMGYQDYSIKFNIGGKEYSATIDWASPMNVSLFMGAQSHDFMEQDGLGLTDMLKGSVGAITGPMLDMSFMSSAKDTVEMFIEQAYDYETGEMNYMDAIMQAAGGSIPQGYLNSFIPQFLSQAAQASDPIQRDTRSTKEDPIAKSWDSWKRKMINKVPVLREYALNPKVDRFGDDKVTGNNLALRVINAFINPSNTKEIKFTDLDKEIIKIYNHLPEETSTEKKNKQYFFYNFTGNPNYDLGDGKRMSYKALYSYGKEKRKQQTSLIEGMTKSKSYKNMTWEMKADEIGDAHWISQAMADKKSYGYRFATERIVEYSDSEKEALKILKANGGNNKDFVDFYITREKLISRSHDYDYHTKALAVALTGNDNLAKAYDINVDKLENAKKYLKRGGSEEEYSNAMCNVISGIEKADVSVSMANKAVSAANFKINKRTYKAMGLDTNKANMGIGLKRKGYTLESLSKMKTDSKYNFDEDESGSLNKDEMTTYINSLGIKDNVEKACLFEYLFPYNANNPFGSIPNYLDMKDDEKSGGGSRGYRRYGGGYRRYGGYGRSYGRTGGSGSSDTEEMSEFEKYTSDLLTSIQAGDIEAAKMNYGSRKLKQKYGDSYSKAVAKLLAKQVFKS